MSCIYCVGNINTIPEHVSCSSGKIVNKAAVLLQTLLNGISNLLTPATHKSHDYHMII